MVGGALRARVCALSWPFFPCDVVDALCAQLEARPDKPEKPGQGDVRLRTAVSVLSGPRSPRRDVGARDVAPSTSATGATAESAMSAPAPPQTSAYVDADGLITPSRVTTTRDPLVGSLTVRVIEARGLHGKDVGKSGATSDPFCEVALLDAKKSEKQAQKTKDVRRRHPWRARCFSR